MTLFHTFKINSFINNKQNNVFTIKCTSPDITTWTGIAEGSNPICVHECFMQKIGGSGVSAWGRSGFSNQTKAIPKTCHDLSLICTALLSSATQNHRITSRGLLSVFYLSLKGASLLSSKYNTEAIFWVVGLGRFWVVDKNCFNIMVSWSNNAIYKQTKMK